VPRLLIAALAVLGVLILPSAASARDRNHDRIPDRWEKKHDLSLHVKQTRRDQDNDGLRNLAEFKSHTDARDKDSDDDWSRTLAEHGDDDGDNSGPGSGDDDDHGDDDDQGEDDDEDECAPGALAVGAKVEEAELELTSAGAVWEEIELR
jgi:hypothetical protein